MKSLNMSEIEAGLDELPGWTYRTGRLRRELSFDDFQGAFAFMNRVAGLAEEQDHHPDWSNVYERVWIALWTHDAGGITGKDLRLARSIDAVVAGPVDASSGDDVGA